MTHRIFIVALGLLTLTRAAGQTFEKVIFNDADADGYFIQLKPPTEKIRGVLVLLPGYGEKAESIFPSSNLFNTAYANGILTIAIAGGEKIYADEDVIERLNRGLAAFIQSNPGVATNQFVMGGFSAGGTISLRYAEYAVEYPNAVPIALKGVFTVDSPIDLGDIWEYFQREIKRNYSEVGVFEAKMVSEKMQKEIGTPETHPEKYAELTPFNHRLSEAGNEKFLRNIAVRVYEDMDVEWQLNERRRSLFDSNALSASELINRLLLMGNERAAFMTAKQPGMRNNGVRHPHSWSIVDEVECIQWILQLFDSK